MSPTITLALLSVNVVAFACSVYFNQQAATTARAIRTGYEQGVRLSKQHRLLLLHGVWIAPVVAQLALSVTLILFNLHIGAQTVSEGLRSIAHIEVFFWGIAVVGTLGFGPIDAFAMRAEVHQDVDVRSDSGERQAEAD
jgi:hypothetical protein